EQKRIADKLDSVLAAVDTCRTRIDRLPATLARLRQSVLAAAISGDLTREWRLDRGIDSRQSWRVVALKDVATSRLGKMLDKGKNKGTATPYLRNINVRWFDFDLTDIRDIRVTTKEKADLSIVKGDVLICEGGEPGRCAVWNGPNGKFVYQKALHRV